MRYAYFYRTTGPWGIGLAAISWSFVAEAKFGLPLSSSGVFKEFETRQQKKRCTLESPAGKCTRAKPKVGVKIRLIQRFWELCRSDCFFRSSLILVCTVYLGLFGKATCVQNFRTSPLYLVNLRANEKTYTVPRTAVIGMVLLVMYLINAFMATSGRHSLLLTTSSRECSGRICGSLLIKSRASLPPEEMWKILFVWFDPLFPVNTFSVMLGPVFLGWTSTNRINVSCSRTHRRNVSNPKCE